MSTIGRAPWRAGRSGGGRAALAALVASVGIAAPAVAAAQTADTTTLTLERALEIARERNPEYRQAANLLDLEPAATRATWFGEILPSASVTLFNTAFTGNVQHRATDFFGNPVANPQSEWVYFSSTRQGLDVSWRIQGASLFHAYARQKLLNRDRRVGENVARENMVVGVRRRFWDALEQRSLLQAEQDLMEARRVDLDVVQRLFSLAMKTRVDVLNAELGIEQQALAAQRQRAEYEKARLALRTVLGDEALGDFVLADEAMPIFDPASLDAEALVRTALDVNPRLRRADVGIETADLARRAARAAWWPTLQLGVNVYRVAQTQETEALFDVSFDEDLDSRFYVQLSFPMFNDFFQNRHRQVEAAVEADNRREEERALRLQVQETVRGALLELSSQHESLRLAERSAEIAGEALRLAQEEYRIGTRTFEALRQSIDAEAETRRQVIRARHSFVDALLSLEEAVGAPVAPAGAGAPPGAAGPPPARDGGSLRPRAGA